MHIKISSAKWRPFCPGGDEYILTDYFSKTMFNFFKRRLPCTVINDSVNRNIYLVWTASHVVQLLQAMAVEGPKWVRCRCRYSKLLRMNGVFVRHRMVLSTKYCEVFSIKLCITLQWHHNGRDGVSNHQPRHCLLNRLVRRTLKKTSKLRVTGPCERNQPVTNEFPAQRTSNAVNVSIWWRHHDIVMFYFPSVCYQLRVDSCDLLTHICQWTSRARCTHCFICCLYVASSSWFHTWLT